jgi:hypothetical protein
LAQHGILVLLRRYWGDDWNIAEAALFFGGFTALILFGLLVNVFDSYLWRTRLGSLMFRVAGFLHEGEAWVVAGHFWKRHSAHLQVAHPVDFAGLGCTTRLLLSLSSWR